MVVFLAHAGLHEVIPGGFGVTVFFFLSGYLITTLLRLEQQESGRISLRDFYLRRVLRILPPFYAVLLLAILLCLVGVIPGHLQGAALVSQFLHFWNYRSIYAGAGGAPNGTSVYWSLAVEEHFYLVFPWLFIGLQRWLPQRWRLQGRMLLGICALTLAWRLVLVLALHAPTDRTYLASDTRLDSILFGCALAVGANPMLDPLRGSPALWRWVLLPLGVAVLIFTFLYRADWFRETVRYTLQGIGLTPIFVVAMRAPGFGPFRLLNWKPVRHLGVLSYSLYLVHFVVIYLFISNPVLGDAVPGGDRWPMILLRGVIDLGISLVLAQAVNRFIEKPCARLRRRLAHAAWLSKAPAAPQPVAQSSAPSSN
jgi:peptidoglycan/LPS O-acetylase OafA/YrhL